MSSDARLIVWVLEQPAWLAPAVGVVGIGVALLMGEPRSRDDRRVVVLAQCVLAAWLVADVVGRLPQPTVECDFSAWPPACVEIVGAERVGAEDVGADFSWISGADDRAEDSGSGGVEAVPLRVPGGRLGPGSSRRSLLPSLQGPAAEPRGAQAARPGSVETSFGQARSPAPIPRRAAGWLPQPAPAPAEVTYGALP